MYDAYLSNFARCPAGDFVGVVVYHNVILRQLFAFGYNPCRESTMGKHLKRTVQIEEKSVSARRCAL